MAGSKARDIKNQLVTLIQGLQLDGEQAFVDVQDNSIGKFDGYPSVQVLPGRQDTDKAAQNQNDRTVVFEVRTHVEPQEDGSEFDYMYELSDLLIDSLDQADADNTFQAAIGTYILNATQGDWDYIETPAGPVLVFVINVEVSYSKDN